MNFEQVISELKEESLTFPARDAESFVPNTPGLYAIFVDDPDSLPRPFNERLRQARSRLVYIGKATDSLRERLVEQDLRHMKPSTFFRGVGAVLGYRPPQGSLIGKRNQNNYRFGGGDTKEIIAWINAHLKVRWVELDKTNTGLYEPQAIKLISPPLNTTHNPNAIGKLAALRKECRQIALAPPDAKTTVH